jgi:hypothetical protein
MTEPVRGRKAAKLFLRDAMYHPDAVVEFPQSGERFDGVESVRQWRSEYPVPTAPVIEEVRGGGDIWVAQLRITYGDGPVNHGVGILEFRDNKNRARDHLRRRGLGCAEVAHPSRSAP